MVQTPPVSRRPTWRPPPPPAPRAPARRLAPVHGRVYRPRHPTETVHYPVVQHHLIAVPELSTTHEGSVRDDFPEGVVDNSAESHGRETNKHRFRYERASPSQDERLQSFVRKRCAPVPNERSRW